MNDWKRASERALSIDAERAAAGSDRRAEKVVRIEPFPGERNEQLSLSVHPGVGEYPGNRASPPPPAPEYGCGEFVGAETGYVTHCRD